MPPLLSSSRRVVNYLTIRRLDHYPNCKGLPRKGVILFLLRIQKISIFYQIKFDSLDAGW